MNLYDAHKAADGFKKTACNCQWLQCYQEMSAQVNCEGQNVILSTKNTSKYCITAFLEANQAPQKTCRTIYLTRVWWCTILLCGALCTIICTILFGDCLAASCTGNIVWRKGRMDPSKYQQIQNANVMQSVKKLKPTRRWSLQDNDSKYTSKYIKKYFIQCK